MRAYKYGGNVNENLLVLNSSDITFSDFFRSVNKEELSEEVKNTVDRIHKMAYRNDVVNNLNMSDDRILFIANNTMVKNPTAISSFGLQEWFISYQFLNRFYDKSWTDIDKVIRFMNLYIGHRFTDNSISDDERKELSELAKSINRQGFSEQYSGVLSPNIIAEIQGKEVEDVILETIEPIEIKPQFNEELEKERKNVAYMEQKIKAWDIAVKFEKNAQKAKELNAKIVGFKAALMFAKKKLAKIENENSVVEAVPTTPNTTEIIDVVETVEPVGSTTDSKESNSITFIFDGDEMTMRMTEFVDFIDDNSYLQRLDEKDETGEDIQINTYDDAKDYAVQKMGISVVSETYAEGGYIGFNELSKKVAKYYLDKPVPKSKQSVYGKTYSKKSADLIGVKVAAKVYRKKQQKQD
jgi:hypothetical protein